MIITEERTLKQYVIATDRGNHCLRIIDLDENSVKDLAGTQGVAGFKEAWQTRLK